ncbi:BgtE-40000 [Blumeria graminis f. sp. tritici]|uniref:BgtE-40000 n=3 Tax=Blumeria graminis TaxID=34373 RepID=A0A061HJ79_BLUGR|nr:hypothetical protein BGT96224_E40000 [Blumeria graminis f. sp. tritici 96224]VCU40818.1 BgtE-40000 [Blumeria graminis f. sp. tritici]
MRLLRLLSVVPFFFSVHVAGDGGYLCLNADGKSNTTYDQNVVEKSVKDACLPDSKLSAAELAANVEAKKYPRVWVEAENYGFNETTLLWKYQVNSSEPLEEPGVLVFTNRACVILGLLQISEEEYLVCKADNEHHDEKSTSNTLAKKPRPGSFSGRYEKTDVRYDTDGYSDDGYNSEESGPTFSRSSHVGSTPENAVSYHEPGASEYDENGHFRYVNDGRYPVQVAPQVFSVRRNFDYLEPLPPARSYGHGNQQQHSTFSNGYEQGSSSGHASQLPTWSSSGEGSFHSPQAQGSYSRGSHHGGNNYGGNKNFNNYGNPLESLGRNLEYYEPQYSQPHVSDGEDKKKGKNKSWWRD